MRTFVATIVVTGIIFQLNAQKVGGYYNSKFLVSIESLTQTPLTNNLVRKKEDYLKFDRDLQKAQDLFNYGFRIYAGVVAKKNLIFGFEGGMDFSDVYMDHNLSIPGYSSRITKIPRISVHTLSFMPKIEIASKRALLPMGFSNQFGIGISMARPVNKQYDAEARVFNGIDKSTTVKVNPQYMNKHFYNFENADPVKTLTIMYALSMRTPLSRHLMLNYGVRYTLNLALNNGGSKTGDYIVTESQMGELIQKQQILTLLRFNLGFTYVF
jgi:hypothetical protein